MNSNILITFIIPAYNCENYLEECVLSILNQKIENIEILIIDDGSVDNTYELSIKLREKYPLIVKTFTKTNGGAASARNYGLKESQGKYVVFVDSDDFLFGNDFEKSINDMKEYGADLLFSDISLFIDGNIQRNEFCSKSILVNKNVLEYVSNLSKFPGSSCAKIYLRQFIIKNNLSFTEGIVNEDIDFMLECLQRNPILYHSNYSWYLYRQNVQNSVTNTVSPNSCIDMFYIIEKNQKSNTNDKIMSRILSYEYSTLFYYYARLPKVDKQSLKKDFNEYRYLLKKRSIKEKILYYVYLIFGLNITANLIRIVYERKRRKK